MGDRLVPERATGIVLFGGRAKDAPYPGSTTVSTINGGVTGMVTTLALEARAYPGQRAAPRDHRRQPVLGRQARGPRRGQGAHTRRWLGHDVRNVVGATRFLLDNQGVSAQNINVDRAVNVT